MSDSSQGHSASPDRTPSSSTRTGIDELNPDLVARIVLACLPAMGPARSRWLVSEQPPAAVVPALAAGKFSTKNPAPRGVTDVVLSTWGSAIRDGNLAQLVSAQFEDGAFVIGPDQEFWPFAEDPEPPLVLFCRGNAQLLNSPQQVAVVGTRRCTSVGRRVAYRLGFDLGSAGLPVVSGLALGVDAAAHRGCLDGGGRPIAVVASGVDVVYPKVNRSLWDAVVDSGVVISEAPAGSKPQRWRFPARNRLIAALGQGTVIVESHRRGGALITAEEAADRGRTVMAVPGSVLSPSAEGCNNLLVDGATPVRDSDDVVGTLGLSSATPETGRGWGRGDIAIVESSNREVVGPTGDGSDELAAPDDLDALGGVIMAELANGPVSVDQLIAASRSTAQEVISALGALVAAERAMFDGVTASLP